MNGLSLDRYLKQCAITKPYYAGVYAIDTVPSLSGSNKTLPRFYLVNTDRAEGPGEHWIILFYVSSNFLEIFDSMGQSPQAYDKCLAASFSGTPGLIVSYTNKRLQSLSSNVCGAHCLFFAYKKCQQKQSLASLLIRYYVNDTQYNDCNVLCFAKRKFRLRAVTIERMLKSTSLKCRKSVCFSKK
jgi:hypothetical protein